MGTLLASFAFLYWLVRGADFIYGTLKSVRRLKAGAPRAHFPKISVIFAGRNEEKRIGAAVRSMLTQDYPDFEVVAVNDRSEDRTLAALQQMTDPRLRILDIRTLPDGWLGKTHALYEGFRQSSGEWILFTDADVEFKPGTLRASLAAAEEAGLDHLALLPDIELHQYIETMFVSYFTLAFAMRFRLWAARNPRSRAYIGIGAFNLIRRGAYEKLGTHRALALDIADDMMLGKKLKLSGGKQEGMFGGDFIRVRWVEGWKGVLNSLHKNGFRGLNYNWLYLIIASAGMLVVDVVPFIGLFVFDGPVRGFFAGAILCIGLCYAAGSTYAKATATAFPAHALASLLFNFILWRSALSALRHGGIGWRGTIYPMDALRRNSTPL